MNAIKLVGRMSYFGSYILSGLLFGIGVAMTLMEGRFVGLVLMAVSMFLDLIIECVRGLVTVAFETIRTRNNLGCESE